MARPRGQTKPARLTVNLDTSTHSTLIEIAKRKDVSVSWVIRRAIEALIIRDRADGIDSNEKSTGKAHLDSAQSAAESRAEERQHTILESIPHAIGVARERDGTLLYCNEPAATLIGRTPEEMVGLRAVETYHNASDREVFLALFDKHGQVDNFEVELQSVDGVPVWIIISARRITFQGEPAFLSAWTGITERKRAEEKLHKSEQTFKAVIDQLPAAIALKDDADRYTLANRTFKEWFVKGGEDIVGRTTFDLYPDDVARELRAVDRRVTETGETETREVTEPFVDGTPHILLTTKFPIRDEDGEIIALGSVETDITARKEAERNLDEKNQLLEDLSTKLSRYLSPQIYEQIFSGQKDVAISTDRKKLTVFFSDIRNFTATTEDLEPEELTFLLNDYLTKMTEIAHEYGATIDKYIGDAMLLFFGDPTTRGVEEDALACVKMAIAMQRRMVDLRAKWRDLGHERPIHMRIGINTGYCNVGNFGSETRMDYTIIGAEVNLAARLQSIGEPDGVMLAHETYALVKHEIDAEVQEPIKVKGISRKVVPYLVKGIFDDLDADRSYIRAENEAMRLYVDLRKLDKEGRAATAEELENCAARLRKT